MRLDVDCNAADVGAIRSVLSSHTPSRAAGEAVIERLAEVSGRLLVLRKRVVPVRRVLEELVSRKTTLVSEATLGFLSLMIGALDRLLTDIASNREILDNSPHLSLTVMSHRTNTTMNRPAVVSSGS